MSWREVLETPSHNPHYPQKGNCGNTGNNGVRGSENNSGNQLSGCKSEKSNSDTYTQYSCYSHKDEMPSRPELAAICRRAVADYPSVPADRLLAFLLEAQDPAWATERAARQLAKRMSEGLIVEGES